MRLMARGEARRGCLIPSGYGNSHLLLGTINIAGPHAVRAAGHSAPQSGITFFVLRMWVCEACDQDTAHVCQVAEKAEKRSKSAYLVHCFLNFHWNDKISVAYRLLEKRFAYTDLQLVSDVATDMLQQPLKYRCK